MVDMSLKRQVPSVRRSLPRTPGLAQVGVALVATLLLATISRTAHQPPPPTIAEFAPQAVQQITKAPQNQSSESGTAENGTGGDAVGEGGEGEAAGALPSPTATPSSGPNVPPPATGQSVKVPSARRCIGDPPRQTEDPRSPPCVAYWQGDNAGGTSPGVTAATVRIGMPKGELADTPSSTGMKYEDVVEGFFAYFNQRFEFYGRKLVPVYYPMRGQGQGGGRRPDQRSSADTAKEQNVFASASVYLSPGYYERLAEHKIIGVYRTPDYTDSYLAKRSPYVWGYSPSSNQILAGLADWACHRLVGGNAAHAGMSDATDLRTQKRTFGIVMQIVDEDSPNRAEPLKAALEACGGEVAYVLEDFGLRITQQQGSVNNEIVKMKQRGVTSVISLLEPGNMEKYQNAGQIQAYMPEWIVSSYPQGGFAGGHWGSKNREAMKHAFGLMFTPMNRVPEDHPCQWALAEAGITNPGRLSTDLIACDVLYHDLLLLASGIQMAGPQLTPETFRDGLLRTKFPNPEHPIQVGKVGFDDGDFSMANDAAEVWYDSEANGPYSDAGQGAFCWVNGGARHRPGSWTRDDPFFKRAGCDYGTRSVS